MASIHIPSSKQRMTNPKEIAAFLAPLGITYQRWPLEDRVDPEAQPEEILAAYAAEIDELKRRGGYVTADVINVTPATPKLDEMLDRFNKEHRHADDEVRFIVKGHGIFHIHPDDGLVFSIQMEAGDMINVPAGTRHWFDLCGDRTIRAIRLFKDPSGWTPLYVDGGVHGDFSPLCWGPAYLRGATTFESTVIR